MSQITRSQIVIWLGLLSVFVLAQVRLPLRLVVQAEPPPSAFSAWTSDAPMIDGLLSPSQILLGERYPAEWENADSGDFELWWGGAGHAATLYVMNDRINLYIAVEIHTEDHNLDDFLLVNFDNDHDHVKVTGDDVLYLDGHSADVETYAGRFQDGFWQLGEALPRADHLNGGSNDGVGACKFTGPKISGTYVFELAHPLNTADNSHDFSLQVGDTVGFNLLYMDAGGGVDSEAGWPTFTKDDWTEMSNIVIAGPPGDPPGLTAFNLQIDKIEVTQAIQWLDDAGHVDNSVPLVRGKSTVVRVYVNLGLVGASVPDVQVYLYATYNGWSRALPGEFSTNGPLRQSFTAPVIRNRDTVDHTANFLLPDYWIANDHIVLEGFVKAPAGRSETNYADNWMSKQAFSFTATKPLKIGYYLIDYRPTAPGAGDNLPGDVSMLHELLYEKIYPTPDMSDPTEYILLGRLTWFTSITLPNGSRDIPAEASLLRTLRLLYVLHYLLDPELDQLVAWIPANSGTPIGGRAGSAAPLGDGRRVVTFIKGINSNSLPHEIGHNLRGPHTWDDPENPYLGEASENKTQTFGFDTRLPYRVYLPTSGDMMSYDGFRWISPWSWELYMAELETGAGLHALTESVLAQTSSPCLLVSGTIHNNNTGQLDPILQLPSSPNIVPSGGAFTIELRGAPPAEPLLYSQSFNVSFMDDCYGLMDEASFMVDLPFTTEAYSVSLWNTSISPPVLLDKITASSSPPQVTVTYPNGGETVGDSFNATWTAMDPDDDSLVFTLLYSSEPGPAPTWKPLAPHVLGTSYQVNTSLLPGGNQSRIKVVASDGFHTSEDQSDDVFIVPLKGPINVAGTAEANITDHCEPIVLRGSAFDPEDGLLNGSALTWTSDLDGFLGTGRVLTVTELQPGLHNITLTAMDSDGNNATDSFTVTVESHNVNVTHGTLDHVTVYAGQTVNANFTVANQGTNAEAVDVFAYAFSNDPTMPAVPIGNQSITGLPPYSNLTVTFNWNTTDSLPGNYTLHCLALPVPGEFLTSDNHRAINVSLRLVGDINGDMKVDMRDIGTAARAFGTEPAHPDWNPDADITGPEYLIPDRKVDMRDIGLAARHFGETYP